MYNYLGILNKSSAVTKVLTCNFLSKEKLNLVLAKGNVIEISTLAGEGLQSNPYLNVYGKIVVLEKVPALKDNKDYPYNDCLFILTQDLDFSIIAYNKPKNEIVNLDKGSVKEDIGKRQDKIFAEFEINYEYVVISAYKNIFKVVFLKNRSKIEDFSIRFDYEELIFFFPIFSREASDNEINISSNKRSADTLNKFQNFGIIKLATNNTGMNNLPSASDTKSLKLECFSFNTFKAEVNKDVISSLDLTSNPTVSMAFSPKVGGLVLFFSNYLKYYSLTSTMGYDKLLETDSKSYSDRKFITFCEVDCQRYLILDEFGNLFLLAFKSETWTNNFNSISQMDVKNLSVILQFLGEVSYASRMTYLDNNYVFIGSEKSNSQLIQITKSPTDYTNRPFIQIVEEYENLAPISDFLVMTGQGEESNTEILSVSGDNKSCCLKTIRKGTSINVDSEIFMSGVNTIFSVDFTDPNKMIVDEDIKMDIDCKAKKLLFLTFLDHTELISVDFESSSVMNYFSENIILCEPSVLVKGFYFENFYYILQVSVSSISIYDQNLSLLKKIKTFVCPVISYFKKKTGFLYIYNQNKIFLKYNLFDSCKYLILLKLSSDKTQRK
jgi:DNA damage-binding protein 1